MLGRLEGGHIFDFPESRITCLYSDFKSLDMTKISYSLLQTCQDLESGLVTLKMSNPALFFDLSNR